MPGDPRQLGGFYLDGRLGAGGQGVVYEGYDVQGRRVAVKVLRAVDAEDRERLRREIPAWRKVEPYCTTRVLEADLDGTVPYVVSEYVAGPDLRRAVNDGGAYGPEELRRLAVNLAGALVAIHRAGVVHRDLKPENILLGPDGPRVIDFGLHPRPLLPALRQRGAPPGAPGRPRRRLRLLRRLRHHPRRQPRRELETDLHPPALAPRRRRRPCPLPPRHRRPPGLALPRLLRPRRRLRRRQLGPVVPVRPRPPRKPPDPRHGDRQHDPLRPDLRHRHHRRLRPPDRPRIPDGHRLRRRPSRLLAANRSTITRQAALLLPLFGITVSAGGACWVHLLQGTFGPYDWGLQRAITIGAIGSISAVPAYVLGFTAWGQWLLLVRIWLPLTGKLPRDTITFLTDAYHRGALRQSGAVYQFRHLRLQHHLHTDHPPGRRPGHPGTTSAGPSRPDAPTRPT
ncbi:protein kinase domain-containing protein [Kitasatospora sp. NPDC094028]